jgi:hypothetical protein
MAEDVFGNAANKQPTPNISNNNETMDLDLIDMNNIEQTKGGLIIAKDKLIGKSYVELSTNPTLTAAADNSNNESTNNISVPLIEPFPLTQSSVGKDKPMQISTSKNDVSRPTTPSTPNTSNITSDSKPSSSCSLTTHTTTSNVDQNRRTMTLPVLPPYASRTGDTSHRHLLRTHDGKIDISLAATTYLENLEKNKLLIETINAKESYNNSNLSTATSESQDIHTKINIRKPTTIINPYSVRLQKHTKDKTTTTTITPMSIDHNITNPYTVQLQKLTQDKTTTTTLPR